VSGSSSVNSSPPKRAAVSLARIWVSMRAEISRSA
jgi:hypothetical protein